MIDINTTIETIIAANSDISIMITSTTEPYLLICHWPQMLNYQFDLSALTIWYGCAIELFFRTRYDMRLVALNGPMSIDSVAIRTTSGAP